MTRDTDRLVDIISAPPHGVTALTIMTASTMQSSSILWFPPFHCGIYATAPVWTVLSAAKQAVLLLRVDGECEVGSPVLWSGPDKLLLRTKGPPPKQRARRVSVKSIRQSAQAVADLRVATQRPAYNFRHTRQVVSIRRLGQLRHESTVNVNQSPDTFRRQPTTSFHKLGSQFRDRSVTQLSIG
jgi:hypothetical protein